MLTKHVQLDLIGPPVLVAWATARTLILHAAGKRTFAFAVHVVGILAEIVWIGHNTDFLGAQK
jgi:hypothetical protein